MILKRKLKKGEPAICDTDYNSDDISLVNMTNPPGVSKYITACGSAPPFYTTKEEAKKAGWVSRKRRNNIQVVLPKRVIGGDIYEIRNGQLPQGKYLEYDINYSGDQRLDHYKTFAKLI